MLLTIKTLKNKTYYTLRFSSFTKIHGCPTQSNYKNLKKEASDLVSRLDDITYDWLQSPTGEECGLLAEIIGKDKYQHLTNLTWVQDVKPATYDHDTNNTTATHKRKQMELEWECTCKTWAIRKVSSMVSQPTSVMLWTKTGTHNCRVSTPPTATQPPSKSLNILTNDGVPSTSTPKRTFA
jgi:hypothetical protein